MIRPELRSVSCFELDLFQGTYTISADASFAFNFEFEIGGIGRDGADIFHLLVCNPMHIQEECATSGSVRGGGTLIVSEFDVDQIESIVKSFLAHCEGETWPDVAHRIERLAFWEFAGMESSLRRDAKETP